MTRVVVSGLGVVSPYGAGAKTFWGGLAMAVTSWVGALFGTAP